MEEILKVEHLHKSFDDLTVLEDINLTVKKGEVVVIVGPSGCGKSTFLRCINGLEDIQDGKVILDGQTINPPPQKDNTYRQRIGMVFQSYELFPHKTILGNVMLAPLKVQKRDKNEVREEAGQLLEKVGLSSKKDNYPRQLSGGQKQRVAIAGIIAMQPKCIILDEPTAMLDPQGRKEVMATIHRMNREQGITMVLITHYMDEAAQCGRVVVMDKGSVVLDGKPEQVFSEVEKLKSIGLDVPQVTELAWELRRAGYDISPGIITEDEFADAVERLFSADKQG